MNIMNALMTGFAAAATTVGSAATSTPKGWTDDYDAALKQAAAESKTVLADFSGSDWCGWCKKLDKEVFAQDEFLKSATNSYVLLMVDSPSDKSLLSEKAKKQNPGLVKKYGVEGFPTVLLIDAKGEVVAKTGYRKGGPAKYLEHLKTLAGQASDPEYKNVVKALETRLDKAAEEFEKALKADAMASYEKHLPALKAVLADAKAVKVSDKNKEALEEVVGPFEGMIESIQKMIDRSKGKTSGDDEEEED